MTIDYKLHTVYIKLQFYIFTNTIRDNFGSRFDDETSGWRMHCGLSQNSETSLHGNQHSHSPPNSGHQHNDIFHL